MVVGGALLFVGFAALFSSQVQGAFTAQTSNGGTALSAAQLDPWIPTSVTTTRTTPTTCQVTWTPAVGLRSGATYDITDGVTTYATGVSGTTTTITVPTTQLTPQVRIRYGTWTSTATTTATTPCTGVPDAPAVTAIPSDQQTTITWPQPDDQGSVITHYTATTSPASQTCTITVPATRTCTFTGLTNGLTYTVSVTATNANGTSTPGTTTTIPYPAGIMTTAGLGVWLDAADITTRYSDSGCTTTAGTGLGSAVQCWKDKSGHARHAAGPVAAAIGPALNALPTLAFNGSSQLGVPSPASTDMTIFAITRTTQSRALATDHWWVGAPLLDGEVTGIGYDYGLSLTAGAPAFGTGSPSDTTAHGPVTVNNGSGHLAVGRRSGTSLEASADGAARATATAAGSPALTNTVTAYLGKNADAATYVGDLGEVIVATTALSRTDERTLTEYLARKWGIIITPGAPVGPTATPGGGQVALSWSAPSWDGGSAITSYTVTASPGGASCTTATTTCTVTGLSGGTTYTFSVTATNAVGTGPASTATGTPTTTVPSAPTGVTATASTTVSGQATVAWTAPTSTGGAAITSYTATATAAGQTTRTCTAASSPCTLSSLVDGVTYSVSVTATNSAGTGPASTATTVTTYPATIMSGTNLKLWLDGADPATLYASSACTGAQASTTVGCWTDKSASANHASQATGTYQPVLSTVAGHPVPSFDGSNDYLSANPSLLPTGTTTGTVIMSAAVNPSVAMNGISAISYGGTTAASQRRITSWSATGADVNGSPMAFSTAWPGAQAQGVAAAEFASGTSVTIWAQGGTGVTTSGAFTTGTDHFWIGTGGDTTPAGRWWGTTPEIIAFTGTLTTAERRTLEDYLAHKWASIITPAAPGTPSATAGNGTAAMSWTTPTWDGGATVTGYTATASPGGQTCTATPPATTCTLTGLTNGTTYTVSVTATNSIGTGPAATTTVTPATTPGAPTAVTATPSTSVNGQASVTWTAPASNGGSAITGYTATATASGQSTVTCTAASSPCTLTGLIDGITYSVTVTATNALGTGTASTATSVTTYPAAIMTSTTMKLWYDAADATTVLTTNCSGAQATTTVACWKDKSGAANNATVVSTSYAAVGTSINGHPTVAFSGTSQLSAPRPFAGDMTWYAVVRPTATVGTTSSQWYAGSPIFDLSGASVQNDYGISITGGLPAMGTGNPDTTAHGPTAIPNNTNHLMSTRRSGGGLQASVDDAARGTATSTNTGSLTASATAYIGKNTNNITYTGSIGELVGFNTAQTTTDQRTIAEYLARKWALTITPSAPTSPAATGGSTQATVSWTTPSWNGGSAITGYTVTSSPGAKTCTTAGTTSCTVTGLTNGTSYTFTVTATNTIGTGTASAASNAVTPN
ncbi:MAG: fibronectin type III domain-containing protein [Kineosporiaceae bacterium]|nr:fibronectin type III domain-containing protein [Kineosporiaceae bacterium]